MPPFLAAAVPGLIKLAGGLAGAYGAYEVADLFDVFGTKSAAAARTEQEISDFARSAGRAARPQLNAEMDAEMLVGILRDLGTPEAQVSPLVAQVQQEQLVGQLERENQAELQAMAAAMQAGASPTFLEKLARMGIV